MGDDSREKKLDAINPQNLFSGEEKEAIRSSIKRIAGRLLECPGLSSKEFYFDRLKKEIKRGYGYNDFMAGLLVEMFPGNELLAIIKAYEFPCSTCLRANTLKICGPDLTPLLLKRGVDIIPLDDWDKEENNSEWEKFWLVVRDDSKVPLDATPEYMDGLYMVQRANSFFPAMALAPKEGENIVELVAAAPGVITTHIATLMKNTGFLRANVMNEESIPLLVENTRRLGLTNTQVVALDGRELSGLLGFDSQDRVLLDAPSSDTGMCADENVKSTSYEEVNNFADNQKKLLLDAIDLVDACSKSGGYIVYTTNSIMVEENEAVINFALKSRNVELVECGLPYGIGVPGYVEFKGQQFDKSLKKTMRYYPHIHRMEGRFVAKLRKLRKTAVEATEETMER